MNWSRSRLAAVFYVLVAVPVTLMVLSALPQHAAPQAAAKASGTQQAGIAATTHATRKCTKRFSKAGDMWKSFFDRTAWKGKLRRKELLRFRCMEFLFCMAPNTN